MEIKSNYCSKGQRIKGYDKCIINRNEGSQGLPVLFTERDLGSENSISIKISEGPLDSAEVDETNCLIMKLDIIFSGSFHNTNCSVCSDVETF